MVVRETNHGAICEQFDIVLLAHLGHRIPWSDVNERELKKK